MMALRLGILLFIGTAIAQFRPPNYQTCDGQRLNSLQASFNDQLGINPSLGIKNYEQLRTAVENVWAAKGADGLSAVCAAFKLIKVGFKFSSDSMILEILSKFSNIQDYEACFFGPIGLVATQNGTATGITMAQAIGYQKLTNQFDFACGAGFTVFANVNPCAAGIFGTTATRNQLNKCQSDFLNGTVNDPGSVCVYAATAAQCYQDTFSSCGRLAGWWGCEYERMGTATYYPQCTQNYCTLNPPR